MENTANVFLDINELSLRTDLSRATLVTIVEIGIIEPLPNFSSWHFDMDALIVLQRAIRLQRELELDWQGAALAIELLKQIETLHLENQRLQSRLARFLQ